MDKEKFETDMAAFGFNQHQDVLTYLSHLETMGWTIEDAKLWVTEKKAKVIEQKTKVTLQTSLIFNCPECSLRMRLLSVNDTSATQTGDSTDKSMWLCPNRECMHTIYNKQTLEELRLEEV